AVEPGGAGRYKIKVTTGSGSLWASDSDPRIGGQEFALALDPDPPDWTRDAVIYQLMVDRFARPDGDLPRPGSSTALYGGTLDGDAAHFYRFWQWPHYYRCFYDVISLPEMDTGSRRVQDYLVDAARHWVTEYGADGVRCDHAAGVDPSFWVELRRGLREVKPDALV